MNVLGLYQEKSETQAVPSLDVRELAGKALRPSDAYMHQ